MRDKLTILGGCNDSRRDSIGASAYVLDVCGKRILIDYGREVGEDDGVTGQEHFGAVPDLSLLDGKKIDAVVLTHGHADHCGGLPELQESNMLDASARVYASPQTLETLPFHLNDYINHGGQYWNSAYDVVTRLESIEKPGLFKLFDNDDSYAVQGGHIPGAMGVIFRLANGKKVMFTGDMCFHEQRTVRGARKLSEFLPREWVPDMILGTDLTYGGTERRSLDEEFERLVADLREMMSRGERGVIAAFRDNRGPAIATALAEAGIPCYVDGAISDVMEMYSRVQWSDLDKPMPASHELIQRIADRGDRKKLLAQPGPWVVVTTSGMGDRGPFRQYFAAAAQDASMHIKFTSYLPNNCFGYKILKAFGREQNERIVRHKHPDGALTHCLLKARVDRYSLGSHASLDEFADYIADIVQMRNGKPLELMILTHGSRSSLAAAMRRLSAYTDSIFNGLPGTTVSLAD